MTDTKEAPKAALRDEAEDQRDQAVVLVGIGVCATSLKSLEQLFLGISPSTGAAYLIAVRQQEGVRRQD